jgi:23S rRNA (uracil-5-)-methyltransferase RumA
MIKCSLFGICGGCSCQNLEYTHQLENKVRRIKDSLAQHNLTVASVDVFSGEEYNYRSRMDFIFHEGGVGFRSKSDFQKVVDVQFCHISDEKINTCLAEIRKWFLSHKAVLEPFNLRRKKGTLRYAVIRASKFTDDSSISFVLNSDSSRLAEHIDLIKDFAKKSVAKNIVVTYVPTEKDMSISDDFFVVKGTEFLTEDLNGFVFNYPIQGFFQNNPALAAEMIKYCSLKFVNIPAKSTLLDLFGGVGAFGISIGSKFERTLVVDNVVSSIDCAKSNFTKNNVKNMFAYAQDAGNIKKLDLDTCASLYVVADPPRSGMPTKTINELCKLVPKKLVYISCNPLQLFKELRYFRKKYAVASVAVFDLFPQTNHCEIVIELSPI